jgi:SAM-dependent methyltransferase
MFASPDISQAINLDHFSKKYQEMGDLIRLQSSQTIVDFGCGNGDLCFYLAKKYGCRCIGIDYSPSAIKIAKDNLDKIGRHSPHLKITFYHRDNYHLPRLNHISVIYLADVVEHMYDHEIKTILQTFKQWGKDITIALHTDNNIYLKIIHPLILAYKWHFYRHFRSKLIRSHRQDQAMHINLTNPYQFTRKMKAWGYELISLSHPAPTLRSIHGQLGGRLPYPLTKIIAIALKRLPFLSPSFYALYRETPPVES